MAVVELFVVVETIMVVVVEIEDEDNPQMDVAMAFTSLTTHPPNLNMHVRYVVNNGTQPYGAIAVLIKAIRVSLPPILKHSTPHQLWSPMIICTLILEPLITSPMR
jgi:hypothetical protein